MHLRDTMPLLARHEGVWDGTYVHFDADSRQIDAHRSRLICRMPDAGPHPYLQSNHYSWDDGRTEVRDFPGDYRDGRLWFDNDLIVGWAAEVALDDKARTIMLYWQRTGDPSLYLYEMIQLADNGDSRCRTWHWIRDGRLVTRTAIQEILVTRDWRAVDHEMGADAG